MEAPRSRRTELGRLERRRISDERLRQSLPLQATRARLPGLQGLPARKDHRVRAHDRRAAGNGGCPDRCSRARLCCGIPAGIDAMIPVERNWKQMSLQIPIYEAI